MSVSFLIQKLAQVLGVHEVTVNAHRNSEWRIDIEWLSFGPMVTMSVTPHGVFLCATHTQTPFPWLDIEHGPVLWTYAVRYRKEFRRR